MATIYKIEFNEYIYIGSTVNMKERQWKHNYILRADEDNVKTKYPLYSTARENGIKEFELIELEKCSIDDRFIREQHYIDLNKRDKLLNRKTPYGFDSKEYYQKNKEAHAVKSKKYREENDEIIKERKRIYYENNKEAHAERTKKYRDDNDDKLKEKSKEYYEINKERIKKKSKEYREKNKERITEWREKNKEQIKQQRKEYREKKKQAELNDI